MAREIILSNGKTINGVEAMLAHWQNNHLHLSIEINGKLIPLVLTSVQANAVMRTIQDALKRNESAQQEISDAEVSLHKLLLDHGVELK